MSLPFFATSWNLSTNPGQHISTSSAYFMTCLISAKPFVSGSSFFQTMSLYGYFVRRRGLRGVSGPIFVGALRPARGQLRAGT